VEIYSQTNERRKFMKRKVFSGLVAVILLAGLLSCATTQQLTKDQEARIILNSIQDNLGVLFDTGKAFVVANPKYQDIWKTKINPSFDVANKTVSGALDLAKQGKYTPAEVKAKVVPLVNSVIALLAQIGAIK
jgi:ABC-type oligopeptide transport system substrate-binding subunit